MTCSFYGFSLNMTLNGNDIPLYNYLDKKNQLRFDHFNDKNFIQIYKKFKILDFNKIIIGTFQYNILNKKTDGNIILLNTEISTIE